MAKIAINGLGRIGKLVLRSLVEDGIAGDVVLLNDPAGDPPQHAMLLEFDSVHGRWALLAVAGLVVALWLEPGYRAVGGGVAFAYLCLVAVVRTPWLRHRLRADLSYGMYVYHWPIETLLATAGATALTQVGFTVAAVILAASVALASWYLVEEPALSHKGFTPSWGRRAAR